MGRRVQKSSASATINYAYDGIDGLEEVDATGAVLARHSMSLEVDEPLAIVRSGQTNYYGQDGLSSITSITDSAGSAAAAYTYNSFGKLTSPEGSFTNSLRYTSRDFDSEVGLYYYRARFYDSDGGRFLNEDPIGFDGGTNFYAYVGNNPIVLNDPTGLQSCEAPCDVSVPSDPNRLAAVATIMGEATPPQFNGTRQYQTGNRYGRPTGAVITTETLDGEAALIASVIVNRSRNRGESMLEVASAPGQFVGYRPGQALLEQARHSRQCNPLCEKLGRAVEAVRVAADLGPSHAGIENFRAVVQRTRRGRLFTRRQGRALRLCGTDFF